MAFKIALTPTYKIKIVVETPNEYGKVDKSDFMAEFKRMDMDGLEELKGLPSQAEVLERVLIGWSGLIGEDNAEVPFNPANRTILLKIPPALDALTTSFWTSIFKAREKN